MEIGTPSKTSGTLEQRKKILIAEGAMYRLGLTEARHEVLSGMRVDVLAKTAFSHLAANGHAALEKVFSMQGLKNFNPASLKILLPLLAPVLSGGWPVLTRSWPVLTRGFSRLSRRRDLIKPVAVGSASLLGVAAVGFLVWRWKKVREGNSLADHSYWQRTRE
jgi:hypothetical protein